MKLNRNILFPTLLIIQIVINLLFVINTNYLFIRTIMSFLSLILMPGLLLILCLRIKNLRNYEYLSYIIGFSLSLLIMGGLLINSLLPLMGVIKPLSDIPVIVGYNLLLLILGITAYLKNKDLNLKISYPKLSKPNWFILLSSLVFLPLGIFGAITLNNGGSNSIALSMIVGIVIYMFIVTLFRKHLVDDIFPPIIYFIGLALLLSYSLRSWHILGWDINHEYQVFQLTRQNYLWTVSNIKDVYNSCLSITILPTILNSFFQINNEYIFKFVYQVLFAIVPFNIYLIVRRYGNSLYAFFASLLFIFQQTFYMEMNAVVRQEIAFIFFTSSILVLFTKTISETKKDGIFLLFGIAMVLSHYSTTYIALIIFFITYFLSLIFKLITHKRFKTKFSIKSYAFHLRIVTLLTLLIATFSWNILITKSYDNIIITANGITKNIGNIFNIENKSSTILSFLFNSNIAYTNQQLDNFIQEFSSDYLSKNKLDTIMRGETKNIDNLHIVNLYPSKQTGLFNKILLLPYIFSKYLIIIGLFIGLSLFIIKNRTGDYIVDIEYIILAASSLLLIVTFILIPRVSMAYNIERLFQQTLVFTSIFMIYGLLRLFKRSSPFKEYILLSVIIIYYLFQSGITATVTHGVQRINIFNYGFEYDSHYTHEEDIVATKWLSIYYDKKSTIYADKLTHIKVDSHSDNKLPIVEYVIPNLVDYPSYVYAGYTNTKKKVASLSDAKYFNKGVAFTNYPFEFLNINKNLIYDNGGAKIYK